MNQTSSNAKTITLLTLDNDEINSQLKITDLENMFDIYQDKRKNLVFDINKTLYINIDKSTLPQFTCDCVMHWTLISYRIYSTTRLAWLLWKLNDVGPLDIFNAKQPGDKILYLPQQYVDDIVSDLNNFDSI